VSGFDLARRCGLVSQLAARLGLAGAPVLVSQTRQHFPTRARRIGEGSQVSRAVCPWGGITGPGWGDGFDPPTLARLMPTHVQHPLLLRFSPIGLRAVGKCAPQQKARSAPGCSSFLPWAGSVSARLLFLDWCVSLTTRHTRAAPARLIFLDRRACPTANHNPQRKRASRKNGVIRETYGLMGLAQITDTRQGQSFPKRNGKGGHIWRSCLCCLCGQHFCTISVKHLR
jgi:hypothetical protein